MKTHREINVDLCRALGVDPATTQRLVLVLDARGLPRIRITRLVREGIDSAALRVVTERCTLVPDDRIKKVPPT